MNRPVSLYERRLAYKKRHRRLNVAGFLIATLGFLASLYVGGYVMLIGGIIQFIHGIEASPVNASDIAWGAVRVICFESAWLIFGLSMLLGALVSDL